MCVFFFLLVLSVGLTKRIKKEKHQPPSGAKSM